MLEKDPDMADPVPVLPPAVPAEEERDPPVSQSPPRGSTLPLFLPKSPQKSPPSSPVHSLPSTPKRRHSRGSLSHIVVKKAEKSGFGLPLSEMHAVVESEDGSDPIVTPITSPQKKNAAGMCIYDPYKPISDLSQASLEKELRLARAEIIRLLNRLEQQTPKGATPGPSVPQQSPPSQPTSMESMETSQLRTSTNTLPMIPPIKLPGMGGVLPSNSPIAPPPPQPGMPWTVFVQF